MKPHRSIFSAGMFITVLASTPAGAAGVIRHGGMCDASAAVPVGATMFVVANDEDNVLRVYKRDESGGPLASFPLNAFLKIDDQDKHSEADLEGSTRIGNRIYWIASHGANKAGKPRPNRRRLFATELRVDGDKIKLIPVGSMPYLNLVEDLGKVKELEKFDLATAATKAPEQDGLNIEGLSRTPEGALLIAFRNPIPDNKALLVPLVNPDEVVDGKAARLGKPIFLSLGGLGIRSIEYSEAQGKYLLVAGSHDDKGEFRLYRWSGVATESPEPIAGIDFEGLRPEALLVYPEDKARFQILSDDGTELVKGKECNDEKVKSEDKYFRSIWVTPK